MAKQWQKQNKHLQPTVTTEPAVAYVPNPEVNRTFEPFLKPTVPEPPPESAASEALRGYPGSVKTGGNIELHPKK